MASWPTAASIEATPPGTASSSSARSSACSTVWLRIACTGVTDWAKTAPALSTATRIRKRAVARAMGQRICVVAASIWSAAVMTLALSS